nr:MAG TPA: hypothetical protein [Caudoviricetes sp.]
MLEYIVTDFSVDLSPKRYNFNCLGNLFIVIIKLLYNDYIVIIM